MKAYGYLRVSGKGQVDGDGLIRQEQAISDYATAHGIEVASIFREEGVSGTKENRVALAEMMLFLEQNGHGVDTVIIEKLDRLSRDLMVQESIIRDFMSHGFNLVSALEGPDLLSGDPTRKFIRHMFGAIAEYEKDMIVFKLRAARERKRARDGKCEGRKSYTETSPEVIREVKRLRRRRKGQKQMPFSMVARELNHKGLRTCSGTLFTGMNVEAMLRRNE